MSVSFYNFLLKATTSFSSTVPLWGGPVFAPQKGMGAIEAKPSIYHYDCYRRFLGDQLEFLKVAAGLSVRKLSARAGFRSLNYLNLIIDGKRNLSEPNIEKVAEALELSSPETEYFKNLVLFNQAQDVPQRQEQMGKLVRLKGFDKPSPLRSKKVHYYSRWYYIPVRELVSLKGFKEDRYWIAKKLRGAITPEQAQEAIDDLIALGLIQRDESGRLQQVDKTVVPDDGISSSALVDFHNNMIDKGKESLAQMSSEERDVSSVTLPVSAETAAKMRFMILEFRRSLLSLAEEDQRASEDVVQLNIQLFPLTDQKVKGESK